MRSRKFSSIDLSLTSSNLLYRLEWAPLNDLHESDHFPIIINDNNSDRPLNLPSKWITAGANWEAFKSCIESPELSGNVIEDVNSFTSSITEAATKSIPRTKGGSRERVVPWWNDRVSNVIKVKKKAFNLFRRNPSTENLIALKKARAAARREILTSKRAPWNSYTSTITPDTPTIEVWKKIKAIQGRKTITLTCLKRSR
ncbi:hypothetical protein JTB14_014701 [Gonioctena quinquepunctata]|nr:hypothetical protein JTB14_014701 [Gonioctena quinquepunctata]